MKQTFFDKFIDFCGDLFSFLLFPVMFSAILWCIKQTDNIVFLGIFGLGFAYLIGTFNNYLHKMFEEIRKKGLIKGV